MTQLSKPDMKPANHCLQEVLFSEVLHLPLMTQLMCHLMTHVPFVPLVPLNDTEQTGRKRRLAVVSIITAVQDFW